MISPPFLKNRRIGKWEVMLSERCSEGVTNMASRVRERIWARTLRRDYVRRLLRAARCRR
jgi:hypothetical protein